MDRIFKTPGFLPFLLIAFLNAFVDLGHKIVIQNTVFKIHEGPTQIILSALINGLILLPFILLFTPAGFISDRYRKPRVMRISAVMALGLTLLITLCYYQGWFNIAFGMTFLLAVQSAFYSPAKYGFIKELAGQASLARVNALVQALTIVAILSGIVVFSLLFETRLSGQHYPNEATTLTLIAPIGWILVLCAGLELWLTLKLPAGAVPANDQAFDWPRYARGRYLRENFRKLTTSRTIWLSIVGLSVFWGISQVVLAAFPAFAKQTLGLDNTLIIQGVMACSGLGIIIGSLIAGRASRHHIETGLVPLGALGILLSLTLLPQLESARPMALDFLLLGISGGLFIVPLNALIQFHARNEELGTVLAGNNLVQNLVMLGFLGLTVFFALQGMSSFGLFHLLTLTALFGALYTVWQLPQSLVRLIIARAFSGTHRVRVLGFDNLPAQGGVLMLGNHISWLDWAMIQIACPRPVRFVMHRDYYDRWYLRGFLNLFGVIPITSGASKEALAAVNQCLHDGEVVCLFPEGAISRNGQLGRFHKGFERAVEGADGVILPFYLHGLWGSRFSRSSAKLRENRSTRARTEVIVAFGTPMPLNAQAHAVKQKVLELSMSAWDEHSQQLDPLPLAWMRAARRRGRRLSLADARGGQPLSGYRTLVSVIALSRLIRKQSPERNIGLLLPTSSAGILTNMATLLSGKTLVNLNYSANLSALHAAVDQAELRHLYTSRRFIDKLAKRGIDLQSLLARLEVHYLEDMKARIGGLTRLLLMAAAVTLPARLLHLLFGHKTDPDQPAAILFSSGSEGQPKGVMLSHRNIMANIQQVSDVLDTRHEDVIMASLPLFHAFGLTVTGLLPLVEGIPAICHPDPTDALTIAKAVAQYKASIFCGTSTFLRLYNRNSKIHPLMLDSLRIVVAGAEKLNPEVRDAFKLKFNKDIYEGYGATETTPVASVNLPDRLVKGSWRVQQGTKPGSVGLPLPGGSFRIVDPHTLQSLPVGEDGLILFGGPQVMLGYLNEPDKTAEAIITDNGQRWYRTGDKGHLDEDGFLTIVDRYSRFAKIGGEMISLGAVEGSIAALLPEDSEVLATALPDDRKGERVALLFRGTLLPEQLRQLIEGSALNPLMRPSLLIPVDEIPKLGSGKNDYSLARQLALEAACP